MKILIKRRERDYIAQLADDLNQYQSGSNPDDALRNLNISCKVLVYTLLSECEIEYVMRYPGEEADWESGAYWGEKDGKQGLPSRKKEMEREYGPKSDVWQGYINGYSAGRSVYLYSQKV